MIAYRKKSIAIWMSALMVLATWVAVTNVVADEGSAEARVSTPPPMWKNGDFWRFAYTVRDFQSTQQITWNGGGTGNAVFTGKRDTYEYDVVGSKDSTYYMTTMTTETWTNGTYTMSHPQYGTSTAGNFKWWSKWTSSAPTKTRISDLAMNSMTLSGFSSEEYAWVTFSAGSTKFLNTSAGNPDQNTQTVTDSPDAANYQFPLDVGKSWQVPAFQEVSQISWQGQNEPDPFANGAVHTYSGSYTDTVTMNEQGSTDPAVSPVTCAAGTFNDAIKIRLTGTYDITRQGSQTYDGTPNPITGSASGIYFDTYRWYSNTVGNIVNFNSSSATTGILLDSYKYTAIPPNYKPAVQEVGQMAYASSMIVGVKEKDPASIEITVIDTDPTDTINWTIDSIVGATTNPTGAQLMDGLPTFTAATTSPDLSGIHTNTLKITAKQPKTVASDEYTIKINVSDGKEMGDTLFTFKVRVYNVNDKPYVATPIPDVWMKENSTLTCTTWKLTDIFKDPDKEAGIDDAMTFTSQITSGPWLTVEVDNATGTVTFRVPDYASFPVDSRPTGWDNNVKESQIKFTATDSGCGVAANKTTNTTNAKLKIDHVNHAPELATNGTELSEKGLAWNEDTADTRLDLKKAFSDPDTYAGDVLAFTWSGNKAITPKKDSNDKVTMMPDPNWNGKETIKFVATDTKGAKKELRVDCEILAVNDFPTFCETDMDIKWSDEESLVIKEATSATGTLNKLTLAVVVKDVDVGDTHTAMWYVNDSQGNVVFKSTRPTANDDDYEFRCAWIGGFSSAGSPYEIKVVVADFKGATVSYVWNLTVLNVNRAPTAKWDSPIDNKSFTKGKAIWFDAWNSSDPDERSDNLTFIWNSSKQGTLGQGKGQQGAQMSLKNLKVGKHIVTVVVMDSDGGQSEQTFTVKVVEQKVQPGFEFVGLVAAVAVGAIVLGTRRRK